MLVIGQDSLKRLRNFGAPLNDNFYHSDLRLPDLYFYSASSYVKVPKSAYDLFSIMPRFKSVFKLIKKKSPNVSLSTDLQT